MAGCSCETEVQSLPSVEDTVDDFFDNTFKWVDMENGLGQYLLMTDVEKHLKAKITQDRNQAYTRLVEGIEEEKSMIADASYITDGMRREAHAKDQALTDILENVVKPLYGKE